VAHEKQLLAHFAGGGGHRWLERYRTCPRKCCVCSGFRRGLCWCREQWTRRLGWWRSEAPSARIDAAGNAAITELLAAPETSIPGTRSGGSGASARCLASSVRTKQISHGRVRVRAPLLFHRGRGGGPVRASAFSQTGIESVGRFWLGSPWTPEETRTWMVSLPSSLGIGPICLDKEIRPSHRASIWRRRSRRPSPRAIFWGERPSTPEPSPRNWLTHGSFFLGTG